MTRLSDLARVARNEAIAKLLRGGAIHIYAGEPPASCDEPAGERPCLVKLALPDSPLSVRAERGGIVARAIQKVLVEREGKPRWWRAVSPNGQTVLQGDARTGEAAAAAFAKNARPMGLAIDQIQLWRGMEFNMPEFRFDVTGEDDGREVA